MLRTPSHRPFVVGTLLGSLPLDNQIKQARQSRIDLVEVRLDSFRHIANFKRKRDPVSLAILKKIKRQTRKPLLLTMRSSLELGMKPKSFQKFSDAERATLLKQLASVASVLDVEIQRAAFAKDMTRWAHKKRIGVIHSAHFFQKKNPWSKIVRLEKASRKTKGDIFKVAVTPANEKATFDFLYNGYTLPHKNKVLIAMGANGFSSRLVGYCFGSMMTYGHLGKSAAPGQISAAALAKKIHSLYPKK